MALNCVVVFCDQVWQSYIRTRLFIMSQSSELMKKKLLSEQY